LRIGRPDLPRQFNDGGLVDVNHVPDQILVERLGLSPAEAARVVEARERLGGFSSAAELCAFAEVPDATLDPVQDRLLFLAAD
jgi:DNA uptake protein ComE-like DNA-binding protein